MTPPPPNLSITTQNNPPNRYIKKTKKSPMENN